MQEMSQRTVLQRFEKSAIWLNYPIG